MLKGKKDGYGKLLMDFYRGMDYPEIVERDDGFISASGMGPRFYFSTFDSWSKPSREAISLAKGRILDIGCGAGRFSLYLQDKGFDVVGIDNSELAVEVCKARGLKNVFPIGIDEIDGILGKFDTVIMFGNNFGLMQSYDKARFILKRLHGMTNASAKIIAEATNPYGTDTPYHLRYHERNRKKGRMGGQLRIRIRHLDYKTPYFDYLLASTDEVKKIVEGTGWELSKTIGDTNCGYVAIINRV